MKNEYYPEDKEHEALILRRHKPCMNCPYNTQKKHNKKDKVYVFECAADVNSYECSHIPELYPHKFLEGGVGLEDPIPNVNTSNMYLYESVFYNTLNDSYMSSLFLGNSFKQVQAALKKRLESPMYAHLRLFHVKSLKTMSGFHIIAVPPKVDRICYPKFVVDLKGREADAIELEEVNLEVERHPAFSSEDEDKVIIRVVTDGSVKKQQEAQ